MGTKIDPLVIGSVTIATPVVLAPMAGVTDPPFRKICRENAEAGLAQAGQTVIPAITAQYAPAGLFVTEMITTRAIVHKIPKTMHMVEPEIGDPVRSVQLYGVDPHTVAKAVEILIDLGIADHIDLNFGCPAAKVTRKGGGAALPWKRDLFRDIVRAAVRAAEQASKRDLSGRRAIVAGPVPVTIKIRLGIDEQHLTYLDAAKIAEDAGIAGICLHARTLAQYYSGQAQWDYIARLVQATKLPVIGNGDVFGASDAEKMLSQTGAAGVEVGRGAQGAPWIFQEIAAWAQGVSVRPQPTLGEVCQLIIRHASLIAEHQGETHGLREIRKHIAWYLRGYAVGGVMRNQLATVSSIAQLKSLLEKLDQTVEFGKDTAGPRGRAGGEKRPRLPEGWIDNTYLNAIDAADMAEAEIDISGG